MSEYTLQIKPLANSAAPIWEHGSSDYPDLIKVAMEDGHVITYRREVEHPHPQCLKSIELIRIMKNHTYGGKHAKRKDPELLAAASESGRK
jgi:hypothetical protein